MKSKNIYEYQWFKPYLVDVVNAGRRTFYSITTEYMTKSEANREGIYNCIIRTRRIRTK